MKNIIKNILLILIFCLATGSVCLAESFDVNLGQDYLMTTEKTIQTTKVDNPDILTLSPFFTIFNEKNVLLLHPQKIGKTNITIFVDSKSVTFEAIVKQQGAASNFHSGDFDVILLDEPPLLQKIKFDVPPVMIEKEDL